MARGFIKLDRGLMDHWIWGEKPFDKGHAWVDLLMMANHATTKAPYKGEIMEFERGTVNRSIAWLAKRWGWSRDKTRRFLRLLERDGMVTINATTHKTTITIENYAFYQDARVTNKATDKATSKATSRQQAATYKNDKNDKNITPPLPPSRGGRKKMRRLDDGSDDGDDYTAMLRKQLEEEMI